MTSGMPSCTTFSSVPQDTAFSDDRDLHLARQVRVVELVGVADAFVGHELEILAAEGMALPVLKLVNDIL